MKRYILVLLALLLLICGCEKRKSGTSKPVVYASFWAVYDFTSKIAGDKLEVRCLVPAGTEPQSYKPASSDMLSLSKASALLYCGPTLESWTDEVRSGISGNKLKLYELSSGIEPIDGEPHVWLDPANVIVMSRHICDALSNIDPDNAAYYEKNLSDFTKELTELNSSYKTTLSAVKSKKIVVAHPMYGYMCKAYGIEQCIIYDGKTEPNEARQKEIADYVNGNGIKYIFYDGVLPYEAAQKTADETGAGLMLLDPFEGNASENADYITVMQNDLNNLATALSELQ